MILFILNRLISKKLIDEITKNLASEKSMQVQHSVEIDPQDYINLYCRLN